MLRVSQSILLVAVPCFLLAGPVSAQDQKLTPGELFGIVIQSQAQLAELSQKRAEAVGDRAVAQRFLGDIANELAHEQSSDDRIKQAEGLVEHYTSQVKSLERPGSTPAYLAMAKAELKWAERLVAAAKLSDPAKRKTERDKVIAERQEVDAEVARIAEPFDTQQREIRASLVPLSQQMTEIVKAHVKNPTGEFAGQVDRTSANRAISPGSATWKDTDGKNLAYAQFHVRDASEIPDRAKQDLLDGKYPIQKDSQRGIWIWAGTVRIVFGPERADMRNGEVLKQQIGQFIDLEGLAAIKPVFDDAE